MAIMVGAAAATVIIVYSNPVSTTAVSPELYLQDGPNYASANTLGLFTATQTGSPANVLTGTTITVNTVTGSVNVYLLNVLDIYNASALTTHVYVYINGTLPTGVSMYYSSTAITFNGNAVTGTLWVTGTQIPLKGGAAADLYLAFVLTGAATGTGTLGFQYLVT
ncbi:hypothetical protein B1B_01314 [mine drainage metagenome]|uniref:Uncharacterized protein n=1 Tax=mine drainage metagenome TaxID=410659 RepID=T1D6B9_9ZZZZ